MLDRSAAPLPEGRLSQLFGDPFGLERRLVFEKRPEKAYRPLSQGARRINASHAGDPLVGDHFQQRMQVLFLFMPLWPAAIDGPADQRNHIDFDDLHEIPGNSKRKSTTLLTVYSRSSSRILLALPQCRGIMLRTAE